MKPKEEFFNGFKDLSLEKKIIQKFFYLPLEIEQEKYQFFKLKVKEKNIVFNIFLENNNFILSTNKWHESFESLEELKYFLKELLKGNIYIEIVWKGSKIKSQKIIQKIEGKEITISKVFYLSFPSLKKKKIEKLFYNT